MGFLQEKGQTHPGGEAGPAPPGLTLPSAGLSPVWSGQRVLERAGEGRVTVPWGSHGIRTLRGCSLSDLGEKQVKWIFLSFSVFFFSSGPN